MFPLFKDGATKRVAFQFQCVTWKLEKALGSIPYEQYGVSEEVQEQVKLMILMLFVHNHIRTTKTIFHFLAGFGNPIYEL